MERMKPLIVDISSVQYVPERKSRIESLPKVDSSRYREQMFSLCSDAEIVNSRKTFDERPN